MDGLVTSGGWVLIGPDTERPELLYYGELDTETAALAGIVRMVPTSQAAGTNVAAVDLPDVCDLVTEGVNCDPDPLIETIDDTLGVACNLGALIPPGGSPLVGTLPPGVAKCVSLLLGTVNLALRTACGTTEALPCVNNLVDRIDDTLGLACGLVPVSPGGNTSGLPPGVSECVETVLGTVNLLLTTVCGSTAGVSCVENLLDRIDETLDVACTLGAMIPVSDTAGALGLPPGAARCVGVVLGAVELVMSSACQSTSALPCINNLLDRIDETLDTACRLGAIPPGNGGALLNDVPPGVGTCVDLVIGVVELVMRTACQSTTATTCVKNLLDTIDGLLGTACGAVPVNPDGSAIVDLPPGVTECVGTAIGTVNLVMIVVCQSTDAPTCAANLLDTIDGLLGTACGAVPVNPDGSAIVDLPPGVTECVGTAIGTVNLVMIVVCQSTDAPTCAANLLDDIDDLLGTACGAVPVDPGTVPGSAELPPGTTECVDALFGTIEFVMIKVCRSTNAATCLANFLDDIDDTLGLVCGLVPVAPDGNANGLPPGAARCVATVLGAVRALMTMVCQSGDPETCLENLLETIGEVCPNLECIPEIDLDPWIGELVQLINDLVAAIEGLIDDAPDECVAGAPPGTSDLVKCAPIETPPGQVLIVTANVRLGSDAVGAPAACPNLGPDEPGYREAVACNANGRVTTFARRVAALASKQFDDGMAYMPDLIALQETFRADADSIAAKLREETGVDWRVAGHAEDFKILGDGVKSDTGLLFNADTMTKIAIQPIKSTDNRDIETTKRHVLGLFAEKLPIETGVPAPSSPMPLHRVVAIASVHFVTGSKSKDLGETALEGVRQLKATWAQEIDQRMTSLWGLSATDFVIAGDLNQNKCLHQAGPGLDSAETELPQASEFHPNVKSETLDCPRYPVHARLEGRGYLDTVLAANGTTQVRFDAQYKDGSRERPHRLDYVYARGSSTHTAASHDITCGQTQWPLLGDLRRDNCAYLRSSERYSDHRLAWAFVGEGVRPAFPFDPNPEAN